MQNWTNDNEEFRRFDIEVKIIDISENESNGSKEPQETNKRDKVLRGIVRYLKN